MKRLVCAVFFCISLVENSYCQDLDLSSYLPNVVDIGNQSFGVITGEIDNSTISFVTVGDKDEAFYDGISVKFHNIEYESTGSLVKKFNIGDYSLALYQCERPKKLSLKADHYDYFPVNPTVLKTFLDNGKSDNQWSNYRESLFLIHLEKQVATLRIRENAPFSRGMPIFNENGSIVGLIANKQENELSTMFEVIDFSVVEQLLYNFGRCKYLSFLRYGQKLTYCEQEEIKQVSIEKHETKTIRQNKKYFFTIAPLLGAGFHYVPSKSDNEYQGLGYTVGVNMVFAPDYPGRLILKPRIVGYSLVPSESAYSGSLIQPLKLQTKHFDIPILLEAITAQFAGENQTLAIGYAPSFYLDSYLTYQVNDIEFTRYLSQGNLLQHKFILEISFEGKHFKALGYYNLQFGRTLDRDFQLKYQNEILRPFEGHKNLSHYVGIEFSWRLWGSWLLKEKI